ncbi:MAG: DUF1573 domain-containing protein [Bacteroidota bacterium]
MKKALLFTALLGMNYGAFAQNLAMLSSSVTEKVVVTNSVITWKETTHLFGDIKQSVPATVEFEFTNVSKKPIVLTKVQGSCGCTATAYDKEPIQPGKSSKITATFNAANVGTFSKTVTVTTNADENTHTLTLQGTVVAN